MGRGAARDARSRRAAGRPLARLILDTSLLVDAERESIDPLDSLVGDEDDVAIAALSAAELLVGVELATDERRDARRAFVEAVFEAVPIEGYDLEVARSHGALLAHTRRSGRPRGAHDLIIAATARAREREVLTADLDDFSGLPGVMLHSGLQ